MDFSQLFKFNYCILHKAAPGLPAALSYAEDG